MNSPLLLSARPSRSARPARKPALPSPELAWIHDGIRYRVTLPPDLRFEREVSPGKWVEAAMGEDVFASTALAISATQWRNFMAYLPAAESAFLALFQFNRMEALHVITRCPALLPELVRNPALTTFVAQHLSMRGGDQPAWSEISAVFERDGVFGLLQWLGLPASPQTLSILRNIADPDLPRRLLEPLRAALWDPETIWKLSHAPVLTDEQLAIACHALAA